MSCPPSGCSSPASPSPTTSTPEWSKVARTRWVRSRWPTSSGSTPSRPSPIRCTRSSRSRCMRRRPSSTAWWRLACWVASAGAASSTTRNSVADPILQSERLGGTALLRLNRPPLNPLSIALLEAIAEHADALAHDDNVKAVVVTGNDKALAAGADVSEFTEVDAAPRVTAAFRAAFDALGAIPRPVIAAIEGFALGGGFELALACDLRVAGEGARLGFPEIQLGIFPGAGGTQRLSRLVGPARAKDLIWSGRHVKADEAAALGLVDR